MHLVHHNSHLPTWICEVIIFKGGREVSQTDLHPAISYQQLVRAYVLLFIQMCTSCLLYNDLFIYMIYAIVSAWSVVDPGTLLYYCYVLFQMFTCQCSWIIVICLYVRCSPVKDTVVVNDRWGSDSRNKHGGVFTGSDRFHPGKDNNSFISPLSKDLYGNWFCWRLGTLQPHKWENAMTADRHSWGYRREAKIQDMLSMDELISLLVSTVR